MRKDAADLLIEELKGAPCWPLPREAGHIQTVRERRALRRSDKPMLKHMAGWDHDREYLIAPMAKTISRTFADFLYGEAPTIEANAESEQDDLDLLIRENRFFSGIKRGARFQSSEGEAWWKIHTNPMVMDAPMIEWCSRLLATPLFYGEKLLAVAFVKEVARSSGTTSDEDDAQPNEIVYRHAEIHCDKRIVNLLFCGDEDSLGETIDLSTQSATASLPDEWKHDLPMLAGRVVNDVDEDPTLGESDYDQIKDLLFALNEALTISSENARLTGKDRIFSTGRILEKDGSFDTSLDVFQVEGSMSELSEDGAGAPIVAVEKKYDAVALWTHFGKLKAEALSGAGIVVQLVGEDMQTNGNASNDSGVAIRLRYLPTVNAALGKAREWDEALPQILHLALLVAALPASTSEGMPGGFGWTYAGEAPTVERQDPLPVDETELVTRTVTAVTGEIMSRRTGIQELHPEWDDTAVDEELAQILAEVDAPADPPKVDEQGNPIEPVVDPEKTPLPA